VTGLPQYPHPSHAWGARMIVCHHRHIGRVDYLVVVLWGL
jgi:hypothetical protein